MSIDLYYTIREAGKSKFVEKMSRFLSFALPVSNAEEARSLVKKYQNEYHDARHVCWAYMLGADRTEWQLNDNGEPSGTAGKPILGQINSLGLTDVLVIVVRYFGGIKLGTPGLIAAYREAARLALDEAGKQKMRKMSSFRLVFSYVNMDGVMRIVKSGDIEIKERIFDNVCTLLIDLPEILEDEFIGRFNNIEGMDIEKL